jgi:hypothetical protein
MRGGEIGAYLSHGHSAPMDTLVVSPVGFREKADGNRYPVLLAPRTQTHGQRRRRTAEIAAIGIMSTHFGPSPPGLALSDYSALWVLSRLHLADADRQRACHARRISA